MVDNVGIVRMKWIGDELYVDLGDIVSVLSKEADRMPDGEDRNVMIRVIGDMKRQVIETYNSLSEQQRERITVCLVQYEVLIDKLRIRRREFEEAGISGSSFTKIISLIKQLPESSIALRN